MALIASGHIVVGAYVCVRQELEDTALKCCFPLIQSE